ncbi:hypothetical protein M426DRAFT_264527 [Hypoxylon sp. CI-4A]|nr:hypothetical protein M426DRAFT_264527 [Hypoxylon sp. CI-4A]
MADEKPAQSSDKELTKTDGKGSSDLVLDCQTPSNHPMRRETSAEHEHVGDTENHVVTTQGDTDNPIRQPSTSHQPNTVPPTESNIRSPDLHIKVESGDDVLGGRDADAATNQEGFGQEELEGPPHMLRSISAGLGLAPRANSISQERSNWARQPTTGRLSILSHDTLYHARQNSGQSESSRLHMGPAPWDKRLCNEMDLYYQDFPRQPVHEHPAIRSRMSQTNAQHGSGHSVAETPSETQAEARVRATSPTPTTTQAIAGGIASAHPAQGSLTASNVAYPSSWVRDQQEFSAEFYKRWAIKKAVDKSTEEDLAKIKLAREKRRDMAPFGGAPARSSKNPGKRRGDSERDEMEEEPPKKRIKTEESNEKDSKKIKQEE